MLSFAAGLRCQVSATECAPRVTDDHDIDLISPGLTLSCIRSGAHDSGSGVFIGDRGSGLKAWWEAEQKMHDTDEIWEDGINSGCSQNPFMYCPGNSVTRCQMAVFLERGMNGSDYSPSGATGIFDDCPVSHWAADWVEQFYEDGITSGCSVNPLMYCPDDLSPEPRWRFSFVGHLAYRK